MAIQLDFFQEKTEFELLEDRVKDLEKTLDKQRKSLYARHGALSKKYIDLDERLAILERGICMGQKLKLNRIDENDIIMSKFFFNPN